MTPERNSVVHELRLPVKDVARAGLVLMGLVVGVYVFAGLMYGVAALLAVARTGVGDPQAGQTDNLDSITAVHVYRFGRPRCVARTVPVDARAFTPGRAGLVEPGARRCAGPGMRMPDKLLFSD